MTNTSYLFVKYDNRTQMIIVNLSSRNYSQLVVLRGYKSIQQKGIMNQNRGLED